MHTLLPAPTQHRALEGELVLDAGSTVSGPAEARAALRRVIGPGTGLALEAATEGDATITVELDPGLAEEAYRLEVSPAGIRIGAGSTRGVVWASQTLRQLLPPAAATPGGDRATWTLPAVSVVDEPRFGWRGVMIDVARHFMPLHDLQALVEQLSAHKYNVLHLHLTEDQGWRFESLRHPRLHTVGGTRAQTVLGRKDGDATPHGGWYTQQQLRSLVAFAAERGITVIPEIEFPGHVTAALVAHPELAVPGVVVDTVGEHAGIYDNVISTDADAMTFVFDVLTELLEVFPSPWIHVGGDEAPRTQWLASPESQQLAASRGLPDAAHLQRWFTEQLRDWLAERGRRLIGWDEICDEGPLTGAAAMAWRGPEKGIAAAQAGLDVVMAPVTATYFDYYPSDLPEEPYGIGGLIRTEDAYAFEPLEGLDETSAARVLGTQCQVWTEYLPDLRRVEYMLWPRACAHAEVAWSDPAERSFAEFGTRLAVHLERLGAMGVDYRPEAGPLPHQRGGTGRRQRIS